MISLAHIKCAPSTSAVKELSDKNDIVEGERHNEKHVQKKNVMIGKDAERSIRPNSQFLSRLVGQISKTNESVSAAKPVINEDKVQDKRALIADLKVSAALKNKRKHEMKTQQEYKAFQLEGRQRITALADEYNLTVTVEYNERILASKLGEGMLQKETCVANSSKKVQTSAAKYDHHLPASRAIGDVVQEQDAKRTKKQHITKRQYESGTLFKKSMIFEKAFDSLTKSK